MINPNPPSVLRVKHGIVIAIAALLLGLLYHLPAAVLYNISLKKGIPVQLYGIDGPWTNAHTAGIHFQNRSIAQNVSVQFLPLHLLTGRAAMRLHSDDENMRFDGTLARGPKAVRLSDWTLDGQLPRWGAAAGLSFLPVDGQLSGTIHKLVWVNRFVDTAEAEFFVRSAAWTLTASPMPLGDFQIQVRTTPDAIIAEIKSVGNLLDASGTAQLLPDRSWNLNVKVKTKPAASAVLGNYVRSLGQADANGYYHLKQKGKLPE